MKSKKLADEATHPIHAEFIKNITDSSAKGAEFPEAILQWNFLGIHKTEDGEHVDCEVCPHKGLKHFAIIQNRFNGVPLYLGLNCYDKFVAAVATGRVESQLLPYKDYKRAVKKHFKEKVDKTFLGWFREARDAGKLPENLTKIMVVVDKLGFPANFADVDLLVAYYRATRLFPRYTLLDPEQLYEFIGFAHQRLAPALLTIDSVPRLMKLVAREKARYEQGRKEFLRIGRWQEKIKAEFNAAAAKEFPNPVTRVPVTKQFDAFMVEMSRDSRTLLEKKFITKSDVDAQIRKLGERYVDWMLGNETRRNVSLHMMKLPMSPDPRRLMRVKFTIPRSSRPGTFGAAQVNGRNICPDRQITEQGYKLCRVVRVSAQNIWVDIIS
ncbi:MAG: hypothetical protein WCJ29_06320 [bacterium]